MIVRLFDVTEPEMPDVGRRSRELVETEFEQITWEHSHVVVDDDGSVRTYCVYEAPTADMVVEHSLSLVGTRSPRSRRSRATSRLRTSRPSDVAEMERRLGRDRQAPSDEAPALRVIFRHEL